VTLIGREAVEAPGLRLRSQEQMDVVASAREMPDEVRTDEPTSSGNNDDAHPIAAESEKVRVAEMVQVLERPQPNFVFLGSRKLISRSKVCLRRRLADGTPRVHFFEFG
jgi:hypothetical protein